MRFVVLFCAVLTLGGYAASAAADPFDDSRYYLQIKKNSEALAIIDSRQFDINQATDEGYTLLHYAAEAGNLEMVKALLARGADPTAKTARGSTVYQMAIGTMVQAEIRKAEAAWTGGTTVAVPAPTNTPPAPAQSPVAAPASKGICDRVRNEQINDGRSPASRPFLKAKDAIWYNHPDELKALIEDCVSINQQDDYGWTLLHHAVDRNRLDMVRYLLGVGASRAVRNKDGDAAADLATTPEMRQLIGPAPKAGQKLTAEETRKKECRQKYEADVALAYDTTGRMSAMRRWEQCLKTGRYW